MKFFNYKTLAVFLLFFIALETSARVQLDTTLEMNEFQKQRIINTCIEVDAQEKVVFDPTEEVKVELKVVEEHEKEVWVECFLYILNKYGTYQLISSPFLFIEYDKSALIKCGDQSPENVRFVEIMVKARKV